MGLSRRPATKPLKLFSEAKSPEHAPIKAISPALAPKSVGELTAVTFPKATAVGVPSVWQLPPVKAAE